MCMYIENSFYQNGVGTDIFKMKSFQNLPSPTQQYHVEAFHGVFNLVFSNLLWGRSTRVIQFLVLDFDEIPYTVAIHRARVVCLTLYIIMTSLRKERRIEHTCCYLQQVIL